MQDSETTPSDLERITALLKAEGTKFWEDRTTGPRIEMGPVLLVFSEAGQLERIQALG